MPVIAIVAAIGTVSAGAAMGGLLGGIMIAGGVMSGLGAVTGNKKLSRLGAVLSLGAGVASFAGLGAAADGLANSVTGAVPGDALYAQGAKSLGDVAKDALGAVKDSLGADAGATQGLQATQATGSTGGMLGGSGLDVAASGAPSLQMSPATTLGGMPSGGGLSSAMGEGLAQTQSMAMEGANVGSGLFVKDAASYLSPSSMAAGDMYSPYYSAAAPGVAGASASQGGILGFIKGNPELAKIGSGLVAGGMASYSSQQKAAAEQAAVEQARARYNNSIINQRMTAPSAIVR